MTINNLRDIIRDYGVECNWRHDLDGRKLLERIEDVPGFVELLGKFVRHDTHGYVGFVNDYPYPIRVMLDKDVVFSYPVRSILDGGIIFGRENDTCIYIGVYIGSGVALQYCFYYCEVSDENS